MLTQEEYAQRVLELKRQGCCPSRSGSHWRSAAPRPGRSRDVPGDRGPSSRSRGACRTPVQGRRRRPALHAVLDDEEPYRWQLEDLAAFNVDDLRCGQVPAAVRAHTGHMGDHLVGIVHLGKMLALGTGLLPQPALRRPTLGPVRRRGLGEPLLRRRHRRVARGAPDPLFQVGEACCQSSVGRFELCNARVTQGQLLTQRCVLGDQFLAGEAVSIRKRANTRNSLQYARRFPRWWMVGSRDLNKYLNPTYMDGPVV